MNLDFIPWLIAGTTIALAVGVPYVVFILIFMILVIASVYYYLMAVMMANEGQFSLDKNLDDFVSGIKGLLMIFIGIIALALTPYWWVATFALPYMLINIYIGIVMFFNFFATQENEDEDDDE